MISSSDTRKGIGFALVAAILFGISTPIAKSLIGQLNPVLLASLLYLGSAAGLGLIWVISRTLKHDSREAPLRRGDLPWLAGAILTGGVAGPVFLMLGLSRVTGSSASLLLNMESD
jgi:drug/metabolite transporter (DMT)-like permease